MEEWKVIAKEKGLTHQQDYIRIQNVLVKQYLEAESQEVKDHMDKLCKVAKEAPDDSSFLLEDEADLGEEEKARRSHARKIQE